MADQPDTLDGEVWKPVVGYEGRYEVSDLGRVRSIPCWIRPRASNDHQRYLKPGSLRRTFEGHHGYRRVCLSVDGKTASPLVHVLVCEAFHGSRPAGHQASHRNGISSDNRAENLRWLSVAENAAEKAVHGTVTRGDTHPKAVLTPEKVREIRQRKTTGETAASIARDLGVSFMCVSSVLRGRTWAWVS